MSKYFGAVGIAVSELEASAAFYTSMLGMVEMETIETPTARQIVLGFEGVRGASVLLMQHTDGQHVNCKDNPVKLVFYVPDAAATLEAVRTANYTIHKEAAAYAPLGGAIIGIAKDPDGYLVEIIQKPPKNKN